MGNDVFLKNPQSSKSLVNGGPGLAIDKVNTTSFNSIQIAKPWMSVDLEQTVDVASVWIHQPGSLVSGDEISVFIHKVQRLFGPRSAPIIRHAIWPPPAILELNA